MTIDFILNGEDVVVHAEAEFRLVDILRDSFALTGTKIGCLAGCCGACTVIFNGLVVQSCLIPAFSIRGSEIITIEGFSQTDEYQDIVEGFSQAGLENCSFCHNGKILTAEALLERIPRPERGEILNAYNSIRCRCTDPDALADALQRVAEIRQRRIYGRSV
ncbi:MAG: 2Fe-2S iron-sulfur cluster binding domain-containing protein [Treponema sp.]|jgi:carbon-monoxide dehydrogenase small subunit|nr:2Fe-2S iron-sulfur cluster binding domain-containing protein [Treponema sp.]